AARLRQAAQHLQTRPAVFAPTFDGGYGLVGFSAALLVRVLDAGEPASLPPAGFARLFEHIDWSTPRVMSQTRARLAELQLDAAELPMMHDIDRPADLDLVPAAWLE
ncbi:DUF2064 domain-containing protein, partial [Lacisediminimonas sp.]|uniref:TIGR04282 family arsenosugar biosynthesis glycosyltransferase n=1 Tax=Lacisediminimonas sp. TaxID=3060582 RepID=UPI002715EBC5